jgi:hypothetical protein
VLRWIDHLSLDGLERLVLHSASLRRFVVDRHAHAMRALLPPRSHVSRVAIVGGGLFPRTALIVRSLLPEAEIVIFEARPDHIQIGQPFLSGHRIEWVCEHVSAALPASVDLAIVPLAFRGDRAAFVEHAPARFVLVHDWVWRGWLSRDLACGSSTRGSRSVVISWLLLKRLTLVTR